MPHTKSIEHMLCKCTCNRQITNADLENYLEIWNAFEKNAKKAIAKYGIPPFMPRGADTSVETSTERYLYGNGRAYALDCIGFTRLCCRNIMVSAPFKNEHE